MPSPPIYFWNDERDELYQLMFPFMKEAALEAARDAMQQIGVSVSWDLVNQNAIEWAHKYTYELVSGITDTSRAYLETAVTQWQTSGLPIRELTNSLASMFGAVRAEMIAVTEVTRAYAEGNISSWRASGVVDGVRWMTAEDEIVCPICHPLAGKRGTLDDGVNGKKPPAHPRCRCYLQPIVNR